MAVDTTAGGPPPSREEQATARADAYVNHVIAGAQRAAHDVWSVGRFLLFVLYLVLAIVSIWIWIIETVFAALRFVVRALMIVLLWLSGGVAPRPGPPARSIAESIRRDLRYAWGRRVHAYQGLATTAATHFVGARRATRTFWHWSIPRQAFALILALAFVGVPLLYVIPRPHYIILTDDNAVHYEDEGKQVKYLVHGVDLFDQSTPREYLNEDAIYLGKVDSQGLKSQLLPGRSYRVWVVGIRWYKYPRLFPNIITATEVDAAGNTVPNPSRAPVLSAPAPSMDR